MKLKKLQIENYKCIHDSTTFDLDDITCLVGKNESGKTAILEALYKFKPVEEDHKDFDLLDYPRMSASEYKERHNDNPDNVLSLTCQLEQKDKSFIEEKIGIDPFTSDEIQFYKGYDNTLKVKYEIDEKLSMVMRKCT